MEASVVEGIGATHYAVAFQAPVAAEWAFPAHLTDGRLVLFGYGSGESRLLFSPDGGMTWDQPVSVPGTGMPLGLRATRDGELVGLRYDGSVLSAVLMSPRGDVQGESVIASRRIVSCAFVARRDGSLLVHLSEPGVVAVYHSPDGLEWSRLSERAEAGAVLDLRVDQDGGLHRLKMVGNAIWYQSVGPMTHIDLEALVAEDAGMTAALVTRTDGQLLVQVVRPGGDELLAAGDGGLTWGPA